MTKKKEKKLKNYKKIKKKKEKFRKNYKYKKKSPKNSYLEKFNK